MMMFLNTIKYKYRNPPFVVANLKITALQMYNFYACLTLFRYSQAGKKTA